MKIDALLTPASGRAEGATEAPGQRRSPRWATPGVALAAVAALYVLAQLVLLSWQRWYEWDEAVYVSQVSRFARAALFESHRARGASVLTLPAAALTSSIEALRAYLSVVSGLALFLAFWPWLRVYSGYVAPLAALLFGLNWITLFFGSEVSPNLYVAFGSVAAVGYLAQVLWRDASRTACLGLALSVAFVAFMRPTDTFWLVLPLAVGAVLLSRGRRRLSLVAVGAGLVLGWLPWVIEAVVRFGGPLSRLRQAGATTPLGWYPAFNFPRHIWIADDTPTCCFGSNARANYSRVVLAWWVGVVLLAVLGLVLSRRDRLRASGVATAVAVAFGFYYVALVPFVVIRFLLPTFALLAVPGAVGVAEICRRLRNRPLALRLPVAGTALAVLAAFGVWQLGVLHQVGRDERSGRQSALDVAEALRQRGLRPPCNIRGTRSPTIAIVLACGDAGINRRLHLRDEAGAQERVAAGDTVVVLWRGRLPRRSFLNGWTRIPLREVPQGGWAAYLPPGQTLGG